MLKYGKYSLVKVWIEFVYIIVLRLEKHWFETKLMRILQTSQGYILRIAQHFTTKLCNFTNFEIIFYLC